MKRLIAGAMLGSMLFLSGCGNKSTEDSSFTVLEQDIDGTGYTDLVYDNSTKVIYIRSMKYLYSNLIYDYTPYYVMNENNEPVVGVYNGDLEWEDCE